MPALTSMDPSIKCDYCGDVAKFQAVNSGKFRCKEKITQCPGHIKKQKKVEKLRLLLNAEDAI